MPAQGSPGTTTCGRAGARYRTDRCGRIAEIARRDDGTCRTGKEILDLMTFITER